MNYREVKPIEFDDVLEDDSDENDSLILSDNEN